MNNMNQVEIGKFIARKRKEQNYTQEQLADKLSVSNKTISKWENGKCMPDYAVIQTLCKELNITLSELMDAEELEPSSFKGYDEEQILDLIRRTQTLENQKFSLYGLFLIVMGIAFLALHNNFGGTPFQDFISGLMLGLAIGEMLVGAYIVGIGLAKRK